MRKLYLFSSSHFFRYFVIQVSWRSSIDQVSCCVDCFYLELLWKPCLYTHVFFSFNECLVHSFYYTILVRCPWHGLLQFNSIFIIELLELKVFILPTIIKPQLLHSHTFLILHHYFPSLEYIKYFSFVYHKVYSHFPQMIINEGHKIGSSTDRWNWSKSLNICMN